MLTSSTCLFGHLIEPPLASEENRGGEYALDQLIAYPFVETPNTFLFDDGEQTIHGRFVLQRVLLPRLQSTFHNAGNTILLGMWRKRKTILTCTGT